MNLLFLTPQLPFPANSGGKIKTNRLLKNLSDSYNVTLGMFLKDDDFLFYNDFKNEFNELDIYTFDINYERSVKKFIGSLLYNLPFSVYRNYSSKMLKQIDKLIIDKNIDCIFVDHFLMFQYVPRNFKGKVIVHEHNAEYVMWERFATIESNFFKKSIIKFESKRIKHFEKMMCSRADKILAAPNDIESLKRASSNICTCKFVETLHLGDDSLLQEIDLKYSREKDILFIGTMSWEANRDAVMWFVNNVFGHVKKLYPEIKFRIVGKIDDEFKAKLEETKDVIVCGFVDDLKREFDNSSIFVAPLRFGSGIKVKVVDALYRGIPVVTTSIGAEGIDDLKYNHLVVCDEPESMANQINEILSSEDRWNELRSNARIFARTFLSWDSVFKNVRKAINVNN